jgi:hypothetical protein
MLLRLHQTLQKPTKNGELSRKSCCNGNVKAVKWWVGCVTRPVMPAQLKRYFHSQSINHRRSHAGLVQQTVQIVARYAITI